MPIASFDPTTDIETIVSALRRDGAVIVKDREIDVPGRVAMPGRA